MRYKYVHFGRKRQLWEEWYPFHGLGKLRRKCLRLRNLRKLEGQQPRHLRRFEGAETWYVFPERVRNLVCIPSESREPGSGPESLIALHLRSSKRYLQGCQRLTSRFGSRTNDLRLWMAGSDDLVNRGRNLTAGSRFGSSFRVCSRFGTPHSEMQRDSRPILGRKSVTLPDVTAVLPTVGPMDHPPPGLFKKSLCSPLCVQLNPRDYGNPLFFFLITLEPRLE